MKNKLLKFLSSSIACLIFILADLQADRPSSALENSVVKVFASVRNPDIFRPWSKQAPIDVTGSGVVIEGNRILTNAHVVQYSNQVQIQANQAGDKINAVVVAIAPSIDLAVLKLEDETFFDAHPALPRATELPAIKDSVLVYGYPMGGNSLSITKGIVSRIEFTFYNYPVSGLRIQLDAAINPGNSGGPAVSGDKMVGLTFSHLEGAENIGYIIPAEEIDFFLNQVGAGKIYAKPAIYDLTQNLENAALRSYLNLQKTDTGIVVLRPYDDDPAYPLKKWDLITKIGNVSIDDQGMIASKGLRFDYHYLIQRETRNGKIAVEIIRDGKHLNLDLAVAYDRPQLLPLLEGSYPRYFVYGPIVFAAGTSDFANQFTGNVPGVTNLLFDDSPMAMRRGDKPAFSDEEMVVVASAFLPHPLAEGYGNPLGHVLKEANGIKIRNLRHLVEVLRDARSEYVTFIFAGHGEETLVFPRKKMLAATDEILVDNGIREQGTADVMEVWRAVAAH